MSVRAHAKKAHAAAAPLPRVAAVLSPACRTLLRARFLHPPTPFHISRMSSIERYDIACAFVSRPFLVSFTF